MSQSSSEDADPLGSEPETEQGNFGWEEVDVKLDVTPPGPRPNSPPHYLQTQFRVVEEIDLKFSTTAADCEFEDVAETEAEPEPKPVDPDRIWGFSSPRRNGEHDSGGTHKIRAQWPGSGYLCSICKRPCPTSGEYSRHSRTHLLDPIKCDVDNCSSYFPTDSVLEVHKKTVHRKTETEDLSSKLNANPTRNYLEPDLPDFQTVQIEEEVELKFCPQDVEVVPLTSRNTASGEITGDGPTATTICCVHCSESFDDFDGFIEHTRTEHFPIRCRCPFPGCNQSFPQARNLEIHINTHTGERPFSCDSCEKSYSTPGALNRHEKVHHTHLFKCGRGECPAIFHSKREWTTHPQTDN